MLNFRDEFSLHVHANAISLVIHEALGTRYPLFAFAGLQTRAKA